MASSEPGPGQRVQESVICTSAVQAEPKRLHYVRGAELKLPEGNSAVTYSVIRDILSDQCVLAAAWHAF